jgi:hypothetical protein
MDPVKAKIRELVPDDATINVVTFARALYQASTPETRAEDVVLVMQRWDYQHDDYDLQSEKTKAFIGTKLLGV